MLAKSNKIYAYKDYLTYDENERIEIIGGQIYNMSPAPSRIHQQLISDISYELQHYIRSNKGTCKVYVAPFDVILKNEDEEVENSKNVVQPDISVICDKSKLTDKGCTGSPDMIIEVVSPYNPSNDFVRKLNLYQEFKVKEYWIVNPIDKRILVYVLSDNGYNAPIHYTFNDVVKVNIFNNLNIDFSSFDL